MFLREEKKRLASAKAEKSSARSTCRRMLLLPMEVMSLRGSLMLILDFLLGWKETNNGGCCRSCKGHEASPRRAWNK